MPAPMLFREIVKTAVYAAAALLVVTISAVELEAWAVRTSQETGSLPSPSEQGRLIRSHTVEQPTVGIIT